MTINLNYKLYKLKLKLKTRKLSKLETKKLGTATYFLLRKRKMKITVPSTSPGTSTASFPAKSLFSAAKSFYLHAYSNGFATNQKTFSACL